MSAVSLTARNATLEDLVPLLTEQKDVKLDAVVPAQAITSRGGNLHVAGMGFAGPIGDAGEFRPTEIADGHLSEKLGIPRAYLRRMREARPDLYDANVNGWLHGHNGDGPDMRTFMARTFRPAEPFGEGVFRALLSDQFKIMDNLDVLVAALSGVRDAGTPIEVVHCNLTENKMRVRVAAPEISALAPVLLDRYISPNGGWTPEGRARTYGDVGNNAPEVFAGFDISNSETGGGAFSVTPVITVPICMNGLKITADALRSVHLGGKLAEGQVRWSDETQRKNVELVTSMARDAVATFLDVEYVTEALRPIEAAAAKVLDNPAEAIKVVAQQAKFTEEVAEGVLSHFIRGGQGTAGGVLNAVTSYAQTVESPDLADELESGAIRCMEVAASA